MTLANLPVPGPNDVWGQQLNDALQALDDRIVVDVAAAQVAVSTATAQAQFASDMSSSARGSFLSAADSASTASTQASAAEASAAVASAAAASAAGAASASAAAAASSETNAAASAGVALMNASPGTRLGIASLNSMALLGLSAATTWPTPDGSGVVVHPSVRFVDGGLHGYRWWAAMTPYAATNNAVENPCVMVSNDGTTWQNAPGITNPLVSQPAGGYNSDPNLVIGPDGTMYLLYREYVAPAERIRLLTSTDGQTWSGPTTVVENTQSVHRLVAPSVVWDGAARQWIMMVVDIAAAPYAVLRLTAPSITGPWTQGAPVTFPTLDSDPWHMDATLIGDQLVGLMDTSAGAVWLITSGDLGSTWTTASRALVAAGGYKSCVVPRLTESGLTLDAWIGVGASTWGVFRQTIAAPSPAVAHSTAMSAAAIGARPYLVGDTFNRPDSSAALGTSTSGAAWTASTGALGIVSGQAYAPAVANSRAVVTLTTADHTIAVRVSGTAQGWLVDRLVDGNNFLRLGLTTPGQLVLQRITSGGVVVLTPTIAVPVADLLLEITSVGSSVTCSVNGQRVFAVTETQGQTAMAVGIQTQNTTCRFDDFYARTA